MMNTREDFAKWYATLALPYKEDFINYPALGEWSAKGFNAGFSACQALNDKRIAELEENLSKTVNMSIELAKTIAELEEKLLVSEVDAKRYQRARLIGCAVLGTSALKNGTVERFQSIDLTIDNDIAKYPTRGEARKA